MHTEVHVHGNIPLRRGVTLADIETALRPWLDYVDVDSLAEATSAHEDEPGVVFDPRRRALELCWTGYVGRKFHGAVEAALQALNAFAEEAVEIEVSYYHEDGRDEYGVVFVGPSAQAVHDAKRRRMIEDLRALLARHFGESESGEVVALVNQLFDRVGPEPERGGAGISAGEPERVSLATSKKHLH